MLPYPPRRLFAVLLVFGPSTAGAQLLGECWDAPVSPAAADAVRRAATLPRVAVAARVVGRAPAVDGRLDDAAWCAAPTITDLVQTRPDPGALATLPTVARVLFDDEAVYVAVRLFDPRPDSIVAPLTRRDDETTSDWVFVEVDTRRDRRSGYSFGLNPRGVQCDGAWSDDVSYDGAWNAVWTGAARVDARGWTAEFRIPWSQVPLARATAGAPVVWGLNVYRTTPHRGETANWSPRLPSVVGVVSRFNELRGLAVPTGRAGLQIVPYTAVTGTREPVSARAAERTVSATVGADVRARPTPSMALALTVHPDFGQVEADPSQVNLTAFETFLAEQRPLFVEGADVFRFPSALAFDARGTSFAQESPFYSRRIGRPPHAGCPAGSEGCRLPTSTTLLGALRLSGRTANGWSGGLFHAWTDLARATLDAAATGLPARAQVEPRTHFTAARASRALAGGDAAVGAMATFTGRAGMRDGLDTLLAARALVLGVDGRARFGGGAWEATGFALVSRVGGRPAAIARLRSEPRHGYTRPSADGAAVADTTPHATLEGVSAQARIARVVGRLQWGVAGRVVSPGFEANDVGFQRNADWLLLAGDWRYERFAPGRAVRRWSIGSSQLGTARTFRGERRAAVANLSFTVDLRNWWGGSLAWTRELPADDPEALRGGPALRFPARDRLTFVAHSNSRRSAQLALTASASRDAETRSQDGSVTLDATGFVTNRLQLGLASSVGGAHEAWQYVGRAADSTGRVHWIVGALRQRTASLTARGTYAFTPSLTLQPYLQVFLSGGAFGEFAEVTQPLAPRAADRVTPTDRARWGVDDPSFSERDLHANLLLRWEFLPGSALFVVWTQSRTGRALAPFSIDHDLARLWRAPASDALLVKVSWWLGT